MPFRLSDSDTEQLVIQNELLAPEVLAQYKAHVAAAPAQSLFDLLVAEGVITQEIQVQLEELLQAQAATAAPAAAPVVPVAPAEGGGQKRRAHRGFDDPGSPAASAPPAPVAVAPPPQSPVPALGKPPVQPMIGGSKPAPLLSGLKGAPPLTGLKAPSAPLAAPAPAPTGLRPPPPAPLGRLPANLPAPALVAPPLQAVAPRVPPSVPARTLPPIARPPGLAAPKTAAGPAPAQASAPRPAPRPAPEPAPEPVPEPAAPTAHEENHEHGHAAPAKAPKIPPGWPGGIAPEDRTAGGIQELLKRARALGASDMHMCVGLPPMVRIHGELKKLLEEAPALKPEETTRLIRMALTPDQWAYFDRGGDLDFSYSFSGGGRYRANIMRQRNGDDFACRIIGEKTASLEELGIPAGARRLTEFAQGLVLVTGPSGHGKTTTMMALVELVNLNRPDHIITVEEPIEYIIEGKKCHVSQREVGPHTLSFAAALRAALRENPDIIVIGELRDYETTSMAISAAETGHLVFASLPTQDAAKTIDKVLDYFPPEEQQQIRLMVSESLRGILSQQLIRKKDGSGRVSATELLFNSVAVGNIIREANTAGLVNAMQLGKNQGMLLMDDSLMDLANKGLIAGEEAWLRASNRSKFSQFAPKPQAAQAGAAAVAPAKPGAPAPAAGPARPGLPGRR